MNSNSESDLAGIVPPQDTPMNSNRESDLVEIVPSEDTPMNSNRESDLVEIVPSEDTPTGVPFFVLRADRNHIRALISALEAMPNSGRSHADIVREFELWERAQSENLRTIR